MNHDLVLSRRLRLARAARGISQRAAAHAAGVKGPMLSLLERGKRRLSAPVLWQLAEFYGVPPGAFFAEEFRVVVTADHELRGKTVIDRISGHDV